MSRAALLQELDRVTSKDVGAVIVAFGAGNPPRAELEEVAGFCRSVLDSWEGFDARESAAAADVVAKLWAPAKPANDPAVPVPSAPAVSPSGAAVDSVVASPPPEKPDPKRSGLSVVTAEYQPVETNDTWTRYAVRVRVANASPEPREFRVDVRFYNADGFQLDSRSFPGTVEGLGGAQIDGDKIFSGPPAVVSVAAEIVPES